MVHGNRLIATLSPQKQWPMGSWCPAPHVLRWVDDQDSTQLVITSISAAELRAGIAVLPRGQRKMTIAKQIERLINDVFGGYVLAFGSSSSSHDADIVGAGRRRGRP